MRGSIALVLVSVACIACSDAPDPDVPPPCNAQACDIREPDCQEDVAAVLRCFRGGNTDMPPVDVISEDEYRALIEDGDDDAGVPSDDDGGTPDYEASVERVMHGYSLIELAPDEVDLEDHSDAIVDKVETAYIRDQDRVIIIDRGEAIDSAPSVALLAHELVNGLQHREEDIDDIIDERPSTLDSRLAFDAVVEGEATHFELVVSAALGGVPPGGIYWEGLFADWQHRTLDDAYEDDYPVLAAPARFPHPFGGYYMTVVYLTGGLPGVSEVFAKPPRSTADVITLTSLGPEPLALAEALAGTAVPEAPAGFALIERDELGSYLYDQFLHRTGLSNADGLEITSIDLIADRVSIFWQAESERTVTAWRLRFIEGAEPTESFVEDFRDVFEAPEDDAPAPADDVRARVWADGSDLMIIAGDHPLDAAWLAEDLAWNPDP